MLLMQIFLWHHCNRDRYTKHALSFQRWTQRIIWRKRLWSRRSWCNNSWRNLCCRWGLFESPGKNSREAIVGLHLGLGWRIKLYPSLSCISSLRCSFSSSSHWLKRLSAVRYAPSGIASIELQAVAMKPIATKRTPILPVRLWMWSATVMIRDGWECDATLRWLQSFSFWPWIPCEKFCNCIWLLPWNVWK